MASSNGHIFWVTGPCGEFPSQRLVMWSLDVSFDLHLNNLHAGDLRHRCTHYDVIVMKQQIADANTSLWRSLWAVTWYLNCIWDKLTPNSQPKSADGLLPAWCQVICNQYDGIGGTHYKHAVKLRSKYKYIRMAFSWRRQSLYFPRAQGILR